MNPDVLETLNALRAFLDGVPDADTLTLASLRGRVLDVLEAPYRDELRRVGDLIERDEPPTDAELVEAVAALEAKAGADHPEVVFHVALLRRVWVWG